MKQILYNAIRTPDGTLLESRYTHDYKTHIDYNSEVYMVDGGREYLRRSITKEPAKELTLYVGDDHELIRQVFTWRTFGLNGIQSVQYKTIANLGIAHIQAILKTQIHIPDYMKDIFKEELKYREK